tara:strand:+ start:43 stop:237 length:195 start_codon:yes stop_codon:yes gene_type:complete
MKYDVELLGGKKITVDARSEVSAALIASVYGRVVSVKKKTLNFWWVIYPVVAVVFYFFMLEMAK